MSVSVLQKMKSRRIPSRDDLIFANGVPAAANYGCRNYFCSVNRRFPEFYFRSVYFLTALQYDDVRKKREEP